MYAKILGIVLLPFLASAFELKLERSEGDDQPPPQEWQTSTPADRSCHDIPQWINFKINEIYIRTPLPEQGAASSTDASVPPQAISFYSNLEDCKNGYPLLIVWFYPLENVKQSMNPYNSALQQASKGFKGSPPYTYYSHWKNLQPDSPEWQFLIDNQLQPGDAIVETEEERFQELPNSVEVTSLTTRENIKPKRKVRMPKEFTYIYPGTILSSGVGSGDVGNPLLDYPPGTLDYGDTASIAGYYREKMIEQKNSPLPDDLALNEKSVGNNIYFPVSAGERSLFEDLEEQRPRQAVQGQQQQDPGLLRRIGTGIRDMFGFKDFYNSDRN
ncbi:hypothetical protein ABW19_dt0204950 [Dactylella cylindrospora]|nr:hypothetical protein ABW19_dt0204950 [Dactylella cylindrospora]